jgi:hypothetical protein
MNGEMADSPMTEPAGPKPAGAGWSRQRLIIPILLVFAAQTGLVFVLGERQFPPSRVPANVPHLQLADNSSDLVALDDPTLFVLPHANDFASAVWLKPQVVTPPAFRWTESPRWLPLPAEDLGATFAQFMRTNRFAGFQPDFKPEPELSGPVLAVAPALEQNTTIQVTGNLAQRWLTNQISLPSLVHPDVVAPSRVQVLVDAAGDVVSAVSLPAESGLEAEGRWYDAETNATAIARTLRFTPSLGLTFGQIIFHWHTVPAATTNAP